MLSEQEEARRVSFEARADDYRRARPPYPAALYEILANRCGLGAGTKVLEIGSGTGQATAELLARGAVVTAVEPGQRMASLLVQDHGGDRLAVHIGRIENVALPAEEFDIVASATAFHWVDAPVALPRLARALRPGGWLALWWTEFGDQTRPTPFRHGIAELYARAFPRDLPPVKGGPLNIDSWCDEISRRGHFTRPEVTQLRWDHQLTVDGARRLFGSFPNVNELDPARREAHLEAIAELVRQQGGVVADPYVTVLYLSRPSSKAGRPGDLHNGPPR